MMTKSQRFATNLKREIKKQGYKLTEFAPDYLDMTIATFTNKCKKGTFTVNDILVIEAVLEVKFSELISGKVEPKKRPESIKMGEIKEVTNIPKSVNDKVISNTKSKLDILKGLSK